jgi:hypothetical protein
LSFFFQPYVKQLPPLETTIFKRYGGNKEKIKLRSKFEKWVLFNYIERNPLIKEWNYESHKIPYFDSVKNKNREYIPDFYIEFTNNKKMLLEVKPYSHIFPSILENVKFSDLNERQLFYYNRMVSNAENNLIKFKAANDWCLDKEMEFCIFTEEGIFNYEKQKKISV